MARNWPSWSKCLTNQIDICGDDGMRIQEICSSITDGSHNPPQGVTDSEYLMLSSKNIFDNNITFVDPRYLRKEDFEIEDRRTNIQAGDVLLTIVGTVGRCAVVPERAPKFTLQRSVAVLHPREDVCSSRFLMYALQGKRSYIEGRAKGVAQKGIYLGEVANIEVPIPDKSTQAAIILRLDKIASIIQNRQQQLSALDDLIKARFVEMFGDPVSNPKGWVKKALSDEAEIRIGPFGSLLHKEDYVSGGHALVNPSHIIDGQIVPDDELTVSDTKYTELSPYHLFPGDVVMGRRGEMGRCAVVEESGLLCGTGSLLIRTHGDLSADFIQKIISFPSFKRTIEDMAVGQTMPNLNVPIVSSFEIIKPPKSVQERYYAFVAQIDKSKSAIQKSLDETQLLFDSLMQQYFG